MGVGDGGGGWGWVGVLERGGGETDGGCVDMSVCGGGRWCMDAGVGVEG